MEMGPSTCLSIRLYLYGEAAPAAAKDESAWAEWMKERFPMTGDEFKTACQS